MKLIAISDLHLDRSTMGVPRFDEARAALDASVAEAVRWGADAWLFLGDAFNPTSEAVVYRCLGAMISAVLRLRRGGVQAVLLAGNHDAALNDGSGDTSLTPLRSIAEDDPGVKVLERPERLLLGAPDRSSEFAPAYALPFTSTAHDYDPAAFLREQSGHCDDPLVILSHLHLEGIIPGEETTEMPAGRAKMFPHAEVAARWPGALVLSGHYHRRQVLRPRLPGHPPIHVIGAPCRFTVGEREHEPAFLKIEI